MTINNILTVNVGGTETYNFNKLESFSEDIQSSLFDRYMDSKTETKWSGLSVLYNLPITGKLTAEFFSNTRYYRWAEPFSTFEKNNLTEEYDELLNTQSNDFVRTGFFQNIKPLLSYQITPKLKVRAAIDLEIQNVNNKFNSSASDIRQQFAVWFPSLSIDYSGYSLSYQEWIDLPSLQHMQPLEREISVQYKFIGNPQLKAVRVRNLRGNFYKYSTLHMLNVNGYINATFYKDSFIQQASIDEKGFNISTVINKGRSSSVNGGISLGKQYRKSQKWQLGFNTGLNYVRQNYMVFLNDSDAEQTQLSVGLSQDFSMNYKSLATINLYYRYNRAVTGYNNDIFDPIITYTHNLGTSGLLRLPKRIVIESNYSYRLNPQMALGFPRSSHILNLALSLLTHKSDRGQLKLSMYDLLNQNMSITRYGNLNALITNEQLILRRYLMLDFLFRFNSMKSK